MKSEVQHLPVASFGVRCLEPTISICKICPATCPRLSSREFYAWRGTLYRMQFTEDPATRENLRARLDQSISINLLTGCHEWKRARDGKGYGRMLIKNKSFGAHRVAYAVLVGPIPEGMMVLHKCDNPICVNPDHLWIGDAADNMRDKAEKGRGIWQRGSDRWNAKINESIAKEIYAAIKEGRETDKTISLRFKVHECTVNDIRRGKAWRHATGETKYAIRKNLK